MFKNIKTAEELQTEADAREAARLKDEAEKARDEAMLAGALYNGYLVSLAKEDGDGLLQVKSAFELGLTDTVIHFKNGTKMPINVNDFLAFAGWFVTERNQFFIGV